MTLRGGRRSASSAPMFTAAWWISGAISDRNSPGLSA